MTGVKPVPDGFHTVTPHLIVKDGFAALEFYKKAFGAELVYAMPGPDGKSLAHGQVRIGDSPVMIGEETPGMDAWKSPGNLGATSVSVHLYVEDCDAVFNRAVEAGGTVIMPPTDMFWGDRHGTVRDPEGHLWSIGTMSRTCPPRRSRRPRPSSTKPGAAADRNWRE